jgi:uncharacterized phage-associated protein
LYSQDLDTAQYLVDTLTPHYGGISPLKLQKLLYYVKAWGLVANCELVASPFMKWKHGPVQPDVYQKYKELGKSAIPTQNQHLPAHLKGKTKVLIDFIAESYAPFHALTLSQLTHQEDPWKLTAENTEILPEVLKSFYGKQPFAENFTDFNPQIKPYIAVQTNLSASFTLDMSEADKKALSVYESFAYYQEQMRKVHKEFNIWISVQ